MLHGLKFQTPVSHMQRIERPALIHKLNSGLHKKLTFLRAPAGYGKTTLLSQWREELAGRGVATLWINLDEADGEPAQFALTMSEGLRVWAASVGAEAEGSVPPLQSIDRPKLVVERLLTSFSIALRSGVIFLDDYDNIHSEVMDAIIGHVIARLPTNLHLVIASRSFVQFSIALLHANGQVTEVTADDLALKDEQVRTLIGPNIPSEAVEAVQAKLSGWPIAAQLLKLCLKSDLSAQDVERAVEQSQDSMAEYLTSQVMSSLSDDARSVMIKTSIFDEINVDLANFICDRTDCDQVFREILKIDALVRTIGEDKSWLRFHQLLREFLSAELASKSDEYKGALHLKASTWFRGKAWFAHAVRHAALAGDYERAARLVEEAGAVRVALVGSFIELERLLNVFSIDQIYAQPRLHVAHAWTLAKRGRIREARASYNAVRDAVAVSEDSTLRLEALFVESMMMAVYEDEAYKQQVLADMEALARVVSPVDHWLQGWINNTLCTIHTRNGAFEAARRAADVATSHYDFARSAYGKVFMQLHLALIELLDGRLVAARAHIEAASEAASLRFSSDAGLIGLIDVVDGQILYERNQTALAISKLDRALGDIASAEGWVEVYGGGFRALSALVYDEEGLEAALAVLDRARHVAAKRYLPRLSWSCDCRNVELLTFAGRLREARALACQSNSFFEQGVPDFISWRERRSAALAEARLMLRSGDARGSLALTQSLKTIAQKAGHARSTMEASILEALAHHETGDRNRATRALQNALRHAVPEGLSRRFVEEGDWMARLLHSCVRHLGVANMAETTVEFVARIMSALKGQKGEDGNASVPHILSGREIEVLKELDQGLATKVIARRLNLSDATVKFHLSNIYRKLGVNSRRMAISVAHQKSLL